MLIITHMVASMIMAILMMHYRQIEIFMLLICMF